MRAGVLIIGSLLWRDGQGRAKWRASYLNEDRKVWVRAPIRYGRRSRSGSYTMTYSVDPHADAEAGRAWFVPLSVAINSIEELWRVVLNLWRVEAGRPNASVVGSTWGTVGLMFSPEARELERAWLGSRSKAKYEVPEQEGFAVRPNGIAAVPWPSGASSGNRIDSDIVLIAANVPDSVAPSPRQIAQAWIDTSDAEYFFENRLCCIHTHDDASILMALEEADAFEAERVVLDSVPKQLLIATKRLNDDFPRPGIEVEWSPVYCVTRDWPDTYPDANRPGVYALMNRRNELLYLGSAWSLGRRLGAYFQNCPLGNGGRMASGDGADQARWESVVRIATAGLDQDRFWETRSIEEFLIHELMPPLNARV